MADITLRWLVRLLANSAAIAVLVALVFNFSFAPWSWNPIEDLLYVRTAGFLLPANHISSALAIAGTAFGYAAKDFDNAFKWTFVILSTVSIHEYVLDLLSWWNAGVFPDYVITFRWFFWLGFVLAIGVVLADRKDRKTMGYIAAFCIAYIGGWLIYVTAFNVSTLTIIAYAPGPEFHSFVPNFFEVTSWLGPMGFWWFRR